MICNPIDAYAIETLSFERKKKYVDFVGYRGKVMDGVDWATLSVD